MTIELTPEDALELRLLLDLLRKIVSGAAVDGDSEKPLRHVERELRRGVEVLDRLLNSLPH